ncbi:G2/M phase-specific E3 ubiquitin-protein ligase-like isoform X1 [Nothobranchius furzeri]|uniref:G2/M phase-specific E3 ubiquitin-protein ligase-like isoform X1 n=1 Tax=Nothobranchius furzeri TaxID=105023 RepID=UPI0039048206
MQRQNPKYSISYYQENRYRYVQYDAALQCNLACFVFRICGEIIATSLVQAGPAPNFFSTWSYHFLRHGQITNEDVPEVTDTAIQNLIQEVERAEEDALTDLSDAIVACGYTGPIHSDRKRAIIEAISLHSVMRLIPMLSQLREGLAI